MLKSRRIYLLTGRNETFADLPGTILKKVGVSFDGREYCPPFSRLPFSEQLDLIRQDLKACWHSDCLLIGRSYGAYLLLHAFSELPAFPGDVLLFSPVLGMALAAGGHYGVMLPRARQLRHLAESGNFPSCRSLRMYLGEADDGCSCEQAAEFIKHMPCAALVTVPDAGHHFSQECYERALAPYFT